jgi:hypothetical protein
MKDVKASLKGIETAIFEIRTELKHVPKMNDYATLRSEIAEIKGRVSQMPTMLQLAVTIVTTWSAGAAIVFTLLRLAR